MSYIWPIMIVIVGNIVYQICTKSVPEKLDPFAALTISYSVSAVASVIVYLVTHRGGGLLREYAKLNWASIVWGLAVICIDVGYIFAYRAGWQISKASTVLSAFLAIGLLIVGAVIFREEITINKVVGTLICLVGLAIINK